MQGIQTEIWKQTSPKLYATEEEVVEQSYGHRDRDWQRETGHVPLRDGEKSAHSRDSHPRAIPHQNHDTHPLDPSESCDSAAKNPSDSTSAQQWETTINYSSKWTESNYSEAAKSNANDAVSTNSTQVLRDSDPSWDSSHSDVPAA